MNHNTIGQRYLNFLIDFTNPEKHDYTNDAQKLFAQNIKKIINARELTTNQAEFISHINAAKEEFIHHTIQPTDTIMHDPVNNICALKFLIHTANNQLTYVVISLLFYNNQGLIEKIDEVYNEVGGWN